MPQLLNVGDLYVNKPLTNVSTAYMQGESAYISDKVFPMISSTMPSGQFWRWPKKTYFNNSVERRAPGSLVPMTSWNVELDAYNCDPFALGNPIPDAHRATADSMFNLDATATRILTRQHLLNREMAWASKFFVSGVWGTDITGVALGGGSGAGGAPGAGETLAWSEAGSDPGLFMQNLKIQQLETTGIEFNTLVITPYVLLDLLNNPLILDKIRYVQQALPQPAMSVLPSALDVERILVAKAVVNSANDTAAADLGFVFNARSALFCYSPPAPGIEVPAAGYTFAWTGMFGSDAYGVRIKKYRDEPRASDIVEAESAWSMKLVSTDLGVFLEDISVAA